MGKLIDITGERFGKLTVLNQVKVYFSDGHQKSKLMWNCLCECGRETLIAGNSLCKGRKDCGECKVADLTGKKFGRLTVLRKTDTKGEYECVCECGGHKVVKRGLLVRGNTKSCGCISRELIIKRNKETATHGMTDTRLHNIWDTMKARCCRPNSKDYKNYGARGIRVCEEWLIDFLSFYHWAMKNGYEEHLSLDRKDVNGNYEPSNCRWATTKEQGNNTRINRFISINGETKTIAQWSEVAGIGPKTLRHRIEAGWKEEDLLLPVGVQKVYVAIGEETKCLSDWAKEFGISSSVASQNYKKGLRGEDIFQNRKRETLVEIEGEIHNLAEWSRRTGINHSYLHKRYKQGIRGLELIQPYNQKGK